MSRRRAAEKRKILPDPRFGSELITKFINRVMMSGKKSIAERIVYRALDQASKKISEEEKTLIKKKESSEILELVVFKQALSNLSPAVEIRARRVGGATYQVPVEVPPIRQEALAMSWLIEAAEGRKEKTMEIRLAYEIIDAINGRGVAIKKRDDVRRMAEANKAFAYFR